MLIYSGTSASTIVGSCSINHSSYWVFLFFIVCFGKLGVLSDSCLISGLGVQEELVHLLLNIVKLSTENKWVQRGSHFNHCGEVIESATHNKLSLCGNADQAKALGLTIVAGRFRLFCLSSLDQLLCCLFSSHISWGHEDWLASCKWLKGRLFHFDVKKSKCVEISCRVTLNLCIERCWSPVLWEKWNGHNFAKTIHLKTTAAHSTNDWCIMDDINFNAFLHAS